MLQKQQLTFGLYRLDPANAQLWRGKQLVRLTRKAFDVLCLLASHPGQLVTKDALLAAVWPEVVVTEAALTKRIQEVRHALRDNPKAPRYIETVHRQGFRFLGNVRAQPAGDSSPPRHTTGQTVTPHLSHSTVPVVGRDIEMTRLHGWLEHAWRGERQLVFVVGEVGIGKTTLVEAFLDSIQRAAMWIGQGQCIEQYGAGEAYLPILEALMRMCRAPSGARVMAVLRQHAPHWLMQLPASLRTEERQQLQRETAGTTQPRMLRELAEAIEVLTAEKPLLLILEDLQWSDYSTVELLTVLARRRDRARLLVIGTYRPVDVLVREHPLRQAQQELQVHGYCQELALDFLTVEAVGDYLAWRFGTEMSPGGPGHDLVQVIHARTDGNPLFMVNVVNDMLRQGRLAEVNGAWTVQEAAEGVHVGIPETLRQLIEQQLRQVSSQEAEVLEAAGIAGAEFSAAAVAAGIQTDVERVEKDCAALARREQFLRPRGTEEWPDGTVAARYGFVHSLYQEVLSARVTAARRVRLHQRIGERLEAGYGPQAADMAAPLAVHFEAGRDYWRATQYRQQAAETALRRFAYWEAVEHLTTGSRLVQQLPQTPEQFARELALHIPLGPALMTLKGYADPAVERTYQRARQLCEQMGQVPQLFRVLPGLRGIHFVRAEFDAARDVAQHHLVLAESTQEPGLLTWAHYGVGETVLAVGDFPLALRHLQQGIDYYDPQKESIFYTLPIVQSPGVACLTNMAWALWLLGYPDQARQRRDDALTLAEQLSHPFSMVFALVEVLVLQGWFRETDAAFAWAEQLIDLCQAHGFVMWEVGGVMFRGSTLVQQGHVTEGLAQLQQGLPAYRATGAGIFVPYFLALLAAAYGENGQMQAGLQTITEALIRVEQTGERIWAAELHRLRGELVLQSGVQSLQSATPNTPVAVEAAACFHRAIDMARQQQARSLELRAGVSLARLWQQQGKTAEAGALLAPIYDWFTEGFDTADLREAKALLDELAH
jgi:DNA-binding winged helix-turn-helix (wHTH) protein/predicted ATPase/type II secretory pathway predicted ATPase ExeA